MNQYFTIAIIAILGAMSPGPDFAVVSKNALSYSRQAGYYTTLGIFSGLIIHSAYCLLGLAIIIQDSPWFFNALKCIGAVYLIYLGIKILLSSINKKISQDAAQKKLSALAAWREGFLVNLLNPKCVLFMITVFTVIIKPHTPFFTQVIYAVELAGLGATWFILLSYLLTHKKINKSFLKIQLFSLKLLGIFLIYLGAHIALFHLR